MKRPIIFLLCLALLMFACTISTTATPPTITSLPPATLPPATVPPSTEPPTATQPPTATEPPTATQPPVPVTNVTCNELSLYLDPALASGYDCKTIPETSGQAYFDVNPQYTELTLHGYPLADRFFTPRIDVFPVQRYSELVPEVVNPDVANLKLLISGGPAGDSLPLLPVFNAAQEFHAQYKVQPITNGSGIRFLTEYAQYADPANNHDMFYTFQGLTADGKYWISAILPISNPILPENGDNPPNGQSVDEFSNNFPAYIVDITNQLNSQAANSFVPTLTALDQLIGSIQIQP